MADRVKDACEACFEAHANDCSGFARAVAGELEVQLHGLANEIGGLKGSEQTHPDPHGHVVVVVAGPLDPTHHAYPKAYWGKLGGRGAKNQWTNWAWNEGDRDRVSYAQHDI